MPELPEVETVRRQLARAWEGRSIDHVWVTKKNYFFVSPPELLRRVLPGQRCLRLHRHGKYLIAHFEGDARLLMHLGMTGQFSARPVERDAHVHVVLSLDSGKCITLRDVRKFGKIEWIPKGATSARLDKLGPDALDATTDQLLERLKGRRIVIKAALLDQSVWAGVGNIYADEALFRSGIHPLVEASRLGRVRVDRLRQAVQEILQQAIAAGGSTINDYLQPDGELGGFQNWHQVYGKKGKPCPRCDAAIQRIVVAARSTHFCRKCQRKR